MSNDPIRQDFLDALKKDEDDTGTRMVFANWLDEQGEHEEAERHRKWPTAKKWLMDLCASVQEYDYYSEDASEEPYSAEQMYEILMGLAKSRHSDNKRNLVRPNRQPSTSGC